jgi:hypothetical protein
VGKNEQNKITFNTSIIHLFFIQLVYFKKRSRIFDIYFNFCGKNQVGSQFNLLTFEWCLLETKNFHCVLLKHIKFHIRKHGLQRKVNDADIDEGFPADIKEAANRATLDLLPSKSREQYNIAYNRFLEWCKHKKVEGKFS